MQTHAFGWLSESYTSIIWDKNDFNHDIWTTLVSMYRRHFGGKGNLAVFVHMKELQTALVWIAASIQGKDYL